MHSNVKREVAPPAKRHKPLVDALASYIRKGVGMDMMLKSFLGIFRLFMLYSVDPADKKKYAKVVDSIIECRMLCNFGRPSMTFFQGIKSVHMRNKYEFWYWLFLCLSIFLRVPEQLSGDLNYLQKVVVHRWSRKRLSFYYRFFKSLSLTCCLLMELAQRPMLKRHISEIEGTDPVAEASRLHAQEQLTISNALIVRTLCDMYVYYKWIPSYKPIKTIEYAAGSLSGIIGVWLVWRDVRYITEPIPAQGCIARKEQPEKDKIPQRMVRCLSGIECSDGFSGNDGTQ